MQEYKYKSFNLNILSSIHLPELMPGNGAEPDVRIRYGKVPERLKNVISEDVWYQVTQKELLFNLENIGKFHVANGKDVIIEPDSSASKELVRIFLLGSVMGGLLFQRGILPLHGSAIQVGDEAVVFVGESGVGKSTLAAAFHQRGYRMLCDDISAIELNENDLPSVFPAFPQLKLWEDSVKQLENLPERFRRIRDEQEKYCYLLHDQFHNSSLRLKKVYELTPSKKPEIKIEMLSGMDKINSLLLNTYRFEYLDRTGFKYSHFNTCHEIAARIPVSKIYRPDNRFLLDEMFHLLEINLGV